MAYGKRRNEERRGRSNLRRYDGADITNKRRAAASQPLETEVNLRTVLEAMQVGCWEWKIATGNVRLSESVERIHGLSPGSFAGTRDSYLAIVHPEDRRRLKKRMIALLRAGVPGDLEFRAIWPDGSVHWIGAMARLVCDDQNHPVTIFGLARDITRRRQAEQAVQNLTAIDASLHNAIISRTPEGIITSWNDAAKYIYGYTRDEAVGRSMAMLIPPDRHDEEARIMSRPRFGQFEAVRLRKDGERIHVAVSVSPILDENGVVTGAVSISQDITLRVALEERLRQRQKVDAIDQLIGGIAHDFNNLLTIIVSCSDEMWFGKRHDPEVLTGLALEIRKAAGLAATMTNRLARLTRNMDVHVARLDLNAAIADLLELLRRALGENIDLCVDLDPAECFVQADAGQIEQILLNLVVNARDAMPRGGRLAIETRIIPPDEPGTGSSAVAGPRSRVLLAVSDTGCGMPADVRSRIFEPFFTTKDNVHRRSGLGLTMVAGIVREMGGHVEVASAVGQGTTFTICLPRTAKNDES